MQINKTVALVLVRDIIMGTQISFQRMLLLQTSFRIYNYSIYHTILQVRRRRLRHTKFILWAWLEPGLEPRRTAPRPEGGGVLPDRLLQQVPATDSQ